MQLPLFSSKADQPVVPTEPVATDTNLTYRTLTLWQPWAWGIASTDIPNPKRIENRPWKPFINLLGQRLAIHAAKSKDLGREAQDAQWIKTHCGVIVPDNLVRSAIVAVVTVKTWVTESSNCWRNPEVEFGWVLEDVTVFEPIPFRSEKGLFMQGLWRLPIAIDQQVKAAELASKARSSAEITIPR